MSLFSDKLPRWATGGGAAVTEPSEGQKDNGWPLGYRVPAAWWNWIAKTAYEWFKQLRNSAISWAFDYTFFDITSGHTSVNRGAATDGNITCFVSGDSYLMVYTYDGINFFEQDLTSELSPTPAQDIAYYSGYWVVTTTGGAFTAVNPLGTWTAIPTLVGENLNAVAGANGYWVAFDSGGDCWYKQGDPTVGSFTENTTSGFATVYALIYYAPDDTWVAAGSAGHTGYVVGAPSGTWIEADLGGSNYYEIIALEIQGATKYLMCGTNAELLSASHPSTGWSAVTLPSLGGTPNFFGMYNGNGVILLGSGSGGGRGEGLLISLDGETFYIVPFDILSVTEIIYSHNRFILTTNGQMWSSRSSGIDIAI